MRYAFWRVSWGRPSRGVGVRKARRQSATTAMAQAPIPSIVFVVGIPGAFMCCDKAAGCCFKRGALKGGFF